MEYRPLGTTGLTVSALCLGSAFRGYPDKGRSEADCVKTIERAVELGCNFIDCANFYSIGGSEELLGRTLKRLGNRADLVVTSKVGSRMGPGPNERGLSRAHIMGEIESSLRRLQMEYVDVYFLHQPDPHTPLDDTLRVMDDIVQQGKARYIGVSNHVATEVVELLWAAERGGHAAPAVLQYQYNLIHRSYTEDEIVPLCERFGLALMTFSPLAIGLLTGQVRAGRPIPADNHWFENETTDEVLSIAEPIIGVLAEVAGELEHTPTQVALAWLLANPAVSSAILGPELPEHIDDLFGAVGWELPAAAKARLDDAAAEPGRRRLWSQWAPRVRQQRPPRR
jgi:aryl-alcohol dehydrogenase-like predicted oxidoreductase